MRTNQVPTEVENTISPAALTEKEAATYLAVSPQFLRLSRHYGNRPGHAEGPPFIRLGGGRSIRYLKSDLDSWLQKHRCHPTPLPPAI
jgi:predicted DNA-binding transcriptional regulator AlpA